LVLEGLLGSSSVPDYVSGVLLADEVSHLLPDLPEGAGIVLCGAEDLCRRYSTALGMLGVDSQLVTEDATVRGLWKIAVSTGLVTGETAEEENLR
jgi:2-dehydro-3-deoxygalactonokinase